MATSLTQRSVLGATAAVWAGQAGAQVATALLFVVLARYADPSEFGRTAVAYGLVLVYAQLVDCGAQQRLLRDAARGDVPAGELRALVLGKVVLAAGLAPVLVPALLVLTGSATAAVTGVLYAAARGVTMLALALWQVRAEPVRAAATTVLERGVAAVAGWALAAAGAPAPAAVTTGLLLGAGAALVPTTALLRAAAGASRAPAPGTPAVLGAPEATSAPGATTAVVPVRRGRHAAPSPRPDLRAALAYGRHYAPVSLTATLVLLDTVLVGAVAGDTEAGHYGMGARLLGPLVVLTAALCTTLVPAVARGAGVRRAFVVVTGLTLALIAVVVAAAPLLVRVAAGPGYEGAVPTIRVYALVAGLAAIAQPVVSWLQARGDERWVGRVLPAGILAGLTGTGVGAALHGAVGGAAGQVAVSAGLCLLLARRFRAVRGGGGSGGGGGGGGGKSVVRG